MQDGIVPQLLSCFFLSVSSDINREQRSHQDDVKGTILTRPSLDIPRLSFQHLKRVWILILTILIHNFGIKYYHIPVESCWYLSTLVWNKMVFCLLQNQSDLLPFHESRRIQDPGARHELGLKMTCRLGKDVAKLKSQFWDRNWFQES